MVSSSSPTWVSSLVCLESFHYLVKRSVPPKMAGMFIIRNLAADPKTLPWYITIAPGT